MATITFITGGQRSGKSRFAQELALKNTAKPIYVATARKWDMDFEDRIERHQADRGAKWQTIEEEIHLGSIDLDGKVAVIDCLTLWLTNIFSDNEYDVEGCLEIAKKEWSSLLEQQSHIIVVSNEVGMGIHSATESGRKFTDLAGFMNQYIASKAQQVYLMVSGIPLKIK